MDIIYNKYEKYKTFNELNFGDCFKLDADIFIKIPNINTKDQDLIGFVADEINCVNLKSGLLDYICPDAKIEIVNAKIIISEFIDC